MSVSDLVGEIEGVRRRTRRASAGAAVPLALLGLLVVMAAPFYVMAFESSSTGDDGTIYGEPGRVTLLSRLFRVQNMLAVDDSAVAAYWLLAAPVTFTAIAAYYTWRARRTGLSLDGWRVAAVGAGTLTVLVASMALSRTLYHVSIDQPLQASAFLNPLLVVAVGVFALAWVERSRGVLAAAVVFLLGVLAADVQVYAQTGSETGWDNIQSWGTATVVLGGWLLLCGAASWLTHALAGRS